MSEPAPDTWNVTPAEAREIQLRLRERLITHPPRGFAPRLVGGADLSIQRFGRRGYAGIVVIDAETMETVDEATAAVDVTFPCIPGLLSFRELPAIVANLATPEEARVRIQVAMVYPKKGVENVALLAAKINDDIIAFVKTLTVADLQGPSGLQALREDLNERAAVRSEGKVREIIIEALVVQ